MGKNYKLQRNNDAKHLNGGVGGVIVHQLIRKA